jgi:hypothetical protein
LEGALDDLIISLRNRFEVEPGKEDLHPAIKYEELRDKLVAWKDNDETEVGDYILVPKP